MENKNFNLFQSIIVLTIFLFAALFGIGSLGLPVDAVLLMGIGVVFIGGRLKNYSYDELQGFLTKGISEGLPALLILIAVGALVGTWIAGGIVPGIIYYGLNIISPKFFLPATFIICVITSLATGTSWGTAATSGIAMLGIGAGLGIDTPVTVGAILSGAYFGDKLSPLSDSTVLTASMSKVDLLDHIRGMLPVSIAAGILTTILFFVYGLQFDSSNFSVSSSQEFQMALKGYYNINLSIFIPIILVFVLLIFKIPSYIAIFIGALLGSLWVMLLQNGSFSEGISYLFNSASVESGNAFVDRILNRGGISWMLGSVATIMFALGFGGMLEGVGILKKIGETILPLITGKVSLVIATIFAGFLGNVVGSAMYVSLLMAPKIMQDVYKQKKISRMILSRNTEGGGTLTSCMVPWTDNGVYMAGLFGIGLSYVPFLWYAFSFWFFSILFTQLNMFMYEDEKKYID